jgi:hypothetical protein
MRVWEELATTALIGTERRQPDLSGPGRLGELLSRVESKDQEAKLLDAASLVAPFRRAGKKLSKNTSPVAEPCPPERLAVCSARLEAGLSRILGGDQGDVLEEWLMLAASKKLLAPPRLLPSLLSTARGRRDLRPLVGPVLGERGSWLARLNPAWGFAVQVEETANAHELWATGTKDERLALVKKLRADDPTKARELVKASWKEDAPEERAQFLAAFIENLSNDDEPFLETALDDKRKEVRRAATDLLARLPASALVARVTERVAPLLNFGPDAVLEVRLPELPDKALIRDGIEEVKEKNPKVGARAATLRQMLAAVPPSFWIVKWNVSVDVLSEAARKSDYADAILDSWAEAAVRHRDLEWCEHLFSKRKDRDDLRVSLFEVLPKAARERIAAEILADLTELQSYQTIGLLKSCNFAWNETLSRLFLQSLVGAVATLQPGSYSNQYWSFFQELERFGNLVSPALLPDVAALVDGSRDRLNYFFNHFERLATRLEFRAEMHQAFAAADAARV